ncbi:replication restart helicase PriA [Sediminitomix flava]|uniref:Replication restart protein PriA n=1 Tax=Sediminitomix flava TaxID=379075 RepID=A0A316A465_SEDFL|nr:primosomal protein N' [Sediminitomix flava]PWJ44527.1 replication restart DNA helicase PriA [Sediminitomix flava]
MQTAIGEIQTLFVDVLLPVPIPKYFRYRVPSDMVEMVQKGVRVMVEFGRRRILTGIIVESSEFPPSSYQAKYLLDILEETPSVNDKQLKFWKWMADYYLCHEGDVLQAALPSGLKLNSQSRIQVNPDFDEEDLADLSDKAVRLFRAVRHQQSIPYEQSADILEVKSPYPYIKEMIQAEAIIIYEEVKEKYKPKKVSKVRLNPTLLENASGLEEVFTSLAKKPKQEDILLKYLGLVPVYNDPNVNDAGVDKKKLLEEGKEMSPSSLKTLVKNGILEEFSEVVSRFDDAHFQLYQNMGHDFELSEAQQNAYSQILESFKTKDATVLHGVTGSGKTEIYIKLIQDVIEGGGQALFLLPEIALSTQMVVRLMKVFGDQLGVYHSRYSDNERVEVWRGVNEGRFSVIVGVRSSIFLPFEDLSLIIVDEEHETSYKQHEPAPRYHARDMALVLGRMHQAKVILGSATPSVESYYLAQKGQFGLVSLTERFGNATLPEIIIADLKKERKQKKLKGDFSSRLVDEVRSAIDKEEQVILFQNRRGYSPFVMCEECSWTPTCPSCAVSLTYHIYKNDLRCHYCGYREATPKTCVSCGSTKIKTVGTGTQKIEEEIQNFVPAARVQRMDQDTTRKKYGYQQIIEDFEQGHIDILVGTQMVSKGLDFDNVTLVGICNMDQMMFFPDFRAMERAFQMAVQVSGRAGRKSKEGKVVIQTYNADHPLLKKIIKQYYEGFFRVELKERHQYSYPPFTRLIKVTVKSEDQLLGEKAALQLAKGLTRRLGIKRVLGPQAPTINKIRNKYLQEVMLKFERQNFDLLKAKGILKEEIFIIETEPFFKKVQIVIDVDPL